MHKRAAGTKQARHPRSASPVCSTAACTGVFLIVLDVHHDHEEISMLHSSFAKLLVLCVASICSVTFLFLHPRLPHLQHSLYMTVESRDATSSGRLVIIGSGLAGLSAALEAARGAPSLQVCRRAPPLCNLIAHTSLPAPVFYSP